MKRLINLYTVSFLLGIGIFSSCKKEYGNLNGATIEGYLNNATKDQLNGLVIGAIGGMRNSEGTYLDAVGVIGREIYRFSGADPRFATDLLGQDNLTLNNTAFYLTNPWGSRYRTIKNCNVIIDAVANTTLIPDNQKKGYTGFAKTLKAHELLMNLNLTYSNGVRVDVDDPKNLGPVLNYDQSITAIADLLDEGKADLTGAEIVFELGDGFGALTDADGLIKFNRALAARVDVYRQQWSAALTDLGLSFYDLAGDFTTGVYQVFSAGAGDQLNSAFFPQNNTGEVRLAHPSFTTDMETNDERAAKATLRDAPASYGGLSGDKDVWVYTSSTAPIPVIRNEELILIYAEANIQSDNFVEGVKALNAIRTGHNLPVYSGAVTKDALINEMLKQRRFSLFFEGHRWVDMRRYDKLNTLPIDRPNDDVWSAMPIPQAEGL